MNATSPHQIAMNWHRWNIFFAWFFIPQTLLMGWVAAAGRIVLELCGVYTQEEDIPGRIVGALLLLAVVFAISYWRHGKLPIVGDAAGNGYRFGHRLVLVANVLASALFVFQLAWHNLSDPNVIMILAQFTSAFGYWVMALWAVGFSFLYQSTQAASTALPVGDD